MDPTHRLTFTPADGSPARVLLLHMRAANWEKKFYSDAQPPSKGEHWAWQRPYYSNDRFNGWACSGQATPGSRLGQVVIEPLKPGWGPTAAAWSFVRDTGARQLGLGG